MPAGFVQGGSNIDFAVTAVSVTLTGVAAGNAIAFFVLWLSNTVTLDSVTGITDTLQDNPTTVGTAGRGAQGYAENVGGGNITVTANFSGAVTAVLHAVEVSGVPASGIQDDHKANPQQSAGTGTDAITSTGCTVTADGILLAACGDLNPNSVPNLGTGFTLVSTRNWSLSEYKLIASGGTQAGTFTETEGFAENVTLAMSFKAAGGGGGSAPVVGKRLRGFIYA
jgi:hypothetical protein